MGDLRPTQEGRIPFSTPLSDKPLETYYKIFGDLKGGQIPLVILHGGPGSGHEYLLTYAKLWQRNGMPIVFYDQIGCASSTRVPEQKGNDAFWQADRFLSELDNVLDHLSLPESGYDMLGHSWGGLLATFHAVRRPRGLRRLALAGSPASGALSIRGFQINKATLPLEAQQAIDEAVQKNDFQNPAYLSANQTFYEMYWSRAVPFPPKEVEPALRYQAEDKTTRGSMMGQSLFITETTVFSQMDTIPLLPQINVPTLVYNGEFDSVHDVSVAPLFEHIPHVRWITFAGASHMMHADNPETQEKVLRVVGDFFMQGKS